MCLSVEWNDCLVECNLMNYSAKRKHMICCKCYYFSQGYQNFFFLSLHLSQLNNLAVFNLLIDVFFFLRQINCNAKILSWIFFLMSKSRKTIRVKSRKTINIYGHIKHTIKDLHRVNGIWVPVFNFFPSFCAKMPIKWNLFEHFVKCCGGSNYYPFITSDNKNKMQQIILLCISNLFFDKIVVILYDTFSFATETTVGHWVIL